MLLKQLLLAATIFISSECFSQSSFCRLSGIVIDSTISPLPSATVIIQRFEDQRLEKAEFTDASGKFLIGNLYFGKYILVVSMTGFKEYKKTISIDSCQNPILLDTIILPRLRNELAEVVVNTHKPFIEQKAGKIIINTENLISTAGSNALEVIQKAPGIEVDQENNILLKGKQGVLVMINNKQAYVSGTELVNILKNTPSGNIKQIEIITNPSSKYDASSSVGIINIKLKSFTAKGLNGNTSFSYGQGFYPKANASYLLNYRNNKLNIYNGFSLYYENTKQDAVTNRTLINSPSTPISYVDITRNSKLNGNVMSMRFGLDYDINKKSSVSFLSNAGYNNYKNEINLKSDFLSISKTLDSLVITNSNPHGVSKNFLFSAGYKFLPDSGKSLSIDMDYAIYHTPGEQITFSNFYNKDNQHLYSSTLKNSLIVNTDIFSSMLNYSLPVLKNFTVEIGLKFSRVNTNNNTRFDSLFNQNFVPDKSRTNNFLYSENILAGYLNISRNYKKLNTNFGLRIENTNAKGTQVVNQQSFTRGYWDLFPAFSLEYSYSDNYQSALSFSKRIDRPVYRDLNPFIEYFDKYSIIVGNSSLLPQYSNTFEWSNIFRKKFIVTLSVSTTKNLFYDYFEQDNISKVTRYFKTNLQSEIDYGINIALPIEISKWWNSSNNFYISRIQLKDKINFAIPINESSVYSNFSTIHNFLLPKDWKIELSGFYKPSYTYGVYNIKSNYSTSFGIQKKIKNKTTINLSLIDIFKTQRQANSSFFSNQNETFLKTRDSRNMRLTVRINLGKSVTNVKEKRTTNQEERNRVQ